MCDSGRGTLKHGCNTSHLIEEAALGYGPSGQELGRPRRGQDRLNGPWRTGAGARPRTEPMGPPTAEIRGRGSREAGGEHGGAGAVQAGKGGQEGGGGSGSEKERAPFRRREARSERQNGGHRDLEGSHFGEKWA